MSKVWIAEYDLKIGADLAHTRGSEVSDEQLKQSDKNGWGWRELTVGEDTKTAARVKEEEEAKKTSTPKGQPEPKPQSASKTYESAAPKVPSEQDEAKADEGKDN